jgi:hypothetical protein
MKKGRKICFSFQYKQFLNKFFEIFGTSIVLISNPLVIWEQNLQQIKHENIQITTCGMKYGSQMCLLRTQFVHFL